MRSETCPAAAGAARRWPALAPLPRIPAALAQAAHSATSAPSTAWVIMGVVAAVLLVLLSRRRRKPTPLGPAATPAAAAAAAALRRASPGDHPPAGHCLRRLDAGGLAAPALCGVCFAPVDGPPGERVRAKAEAGAEPSTTALPPPPTSTIPLPPPRRRRWRRRGAACCDVCGVAVHEGGCARRLAADCRPSATGGCGGGCGHPPGPPASPGPPRPPPHHPSTTAHHWRAAATVVSLADADAALERGPSAPDAVWETVIGPGVAGPADALGRGAATAASSLPSGPPPCLYCRLPTDAGVEAVWACTWCGDACHPGCHAAAAEKLAAEAGGGVSDAPPATPPPPTGLAGLLRRRSSPARSPSPLRRGLSPAPSATVGIAGSGGEKGGEAAAPPPPPPPPPAWLASASASDLARAAACRLGRPAYAGLVLPPSAVTPAPAVAGAGWAARAAGWVAAAARRASAGGDATPAPPASASPSRPTTAPPGGRPPVHADEGHASPGLLAGDSDDAGPPHGARGPPCPSPAPPTALGAAAAPAPAPAPPRPPPPPRAALLGRAPPRSPWSAVSIDPAALPPTCTPLLVVLNTGSGPQLGRALRRAFLRRLNPLQVCEVPRHAPDAALAALGRLPRARILAVGGDGTVGWVLGVLDRLGAEAAAEADAAEAEGRPRPPRWAAPPVAILPLGTGNDLARTLGWGGGLGSVRAAGLDALLADVAGAALTLVDRWAVAVSDGHGGGGADAASAAAPAAAPANEHPPPPPPPSSAVVKPMTNYVGFGVDAKVALDFHAARAAYPAWFTSQVGNKLWYTGLGGVEALARAGGRGLPDRLTLICDGARVPLPPGTEGVLLLNIPSYMGGVDLWGSGVEEDGGGGKGSGSGGAGGRSPVGGAHPPTNKLPQPPHPRHAPPSFGDGRLEVVAVYGSWHLGQLQVGLARAVRLTQCSSARVVVSGGAAAADSAPPSRRRSPPSSLAVQVDGEPWLAPAPAVFEVGRSGHARMLRRLDRSGPLARLAGGVADALAAATARGVITPAQREALATEIAARMHRV